MTKPSRKPSRATMVTAGVAAGVFAAGTGLGVAVSALSPPGEDGTVRLTTGTYILDPGTGTWTALTPEERDAPPAGAGDTGAAGTRICLSLTPDGRALTDAGSGCASLSEVGIALASAQVPGNPSSDPAPPKKSADPPKSSGSKSSNSGSGSRQAAPKQQNAAPPVQQKRTTAAPPAAAPKSAAPKVAASKSTAPKPTQKAAEKQDEGSKITEPVPAERVHTSGPQASSPAQPSSGTTPPPGDGTARPPEDERRSARPDGADTRAKNGQRTDDRTRAGQRTDRRPDTGERRDRGAGTGRPPEEGGRTGQDEPTRSADRPQAAATSVPPARSEETLPPSAERLRPAVPRHKSRSPQTPPDTGTSQAPENARPQDTEAPAPEDTRAPAPLETQAPPVPDPAGSPGGEAPPVVSVPADEGSPDGGFSLPVLRDPELLRRAQKALGLDRNMRYTDANGVWDLNVAPPGTPPCRDYSTAELAELRSASGGRALPENAVPRDSCRLPAFLRWLFAEPAPGEVSNWTKFTGLSDSSLELVVTDSPGRRPGPRPTSGTDRPVEPEQEPPAWTDRTDRPDLVQPDPGGADSTQPGGSDPARPGAGLPDHRGQGYGEQGHDRSGYGGPRDEGLSGDSGYGDSGYGDSGYGETAPDPAGYTNP
ncbi:hypothetical protein ACFOWE_02555 [Planomonospora corallina]|uniref:Uncharacterized protein n=1 Tax=Planomonospora corallina TaxID=1806052 RepID=A0ABV8HZ00_9ACTN